MEHVTVHGGGQAIVGNVTGGPGAQPKSEEQPDAKQLTYAPGETLPSEIQAQRQPCRSPAVRGFQVCRMHGAGGGAPKGNCNALKHGRYTSKAIQSRRCLNMVARIARQKLREIDLG